MDPDLIDGSLMSCCRLGHMGGVVDTFHVCTCPNTKGRDHAPEPRTGSGVVEDRCGGPGSNRRIVVELLSVRAHGWGGGYLSREHMLKYERTQPRPRASNRKWRCSGREAMAKNPDLIDGLLSPNRVEMMKRGTRI